MYESLSQRAHYVNAKRTDSSRIFDLRNFSYVETLYIHIDFFRVTRCSTTVSLIRPLINRDLSRRPATIRKIQANYTRGGRRVN